jgi:hypothetical protein
MTPPDVYVYELTATRSAVREASVRAVTLAILDVCPEGHLYRWTVAITQEQALQLRGLPWVLTPGQRGQMHQVGDNLEFHDAMRGETWSVSIESLAR